MTEKEVKDLTIFLSNNGAYISKACLYNEPAEFKRMLSDEECMAFVTWFFVEMFKKNPGKEITLSMCGLPTFKVTDIRQGSIENAEKYLKKIEEDGNIA